MGQAELRSSGLLSPKSGPLVKGVANSNIKTEANQPLPARNDRSDRIEAPLPVTPERLELIKAYARGRARIADEAATSRIAQRFAPRTPDAPPPAAAAKPAAVPAQTVPLTGLNAGIRRLAAVLIAAALIPNLTLAVLWLGLVDPPWSESASPSPKETERMAATPAAPQPEQSSPPAAQAAAPPTFSPVLTAPNVLDAAQGESVSFPIALDGTDGVPEESVIVIKGLPPGSTLSDGYSSGPMEWRLRPDAIGDLRLAVEDAAPGETTLLVQLVAPDAKIIATASTTLRTRSEPGPNPDPFDIAQAARALDIEARAPEAGLEEKFVVETASIDTVPLPDRRPEPPGESNWIRPTAWVNLRESPSPSAAVVTIVPKGVKLRIIGRKRSWVQVNNPATSQSGWIYGNNVAAAR
ncbi:MAG: SH3 domain-containing protein [Methyloceanibacter sp.]